MIHVERYFRSVDDGSQHNEMTTGFNKQNDKIEITTASSAVVTTL